MSDYTTNLNLLKKDPETDGNDYFNIETMLNDNWDKIDAGVAAKETPAGAQAKVDNLAGAGRTTQTVKGNADAIAALNQTVTSHSADIEQLQNEVQNSLPSGTLSLSTASPVTSIDAKVNGGLNLEMEASTLTVNYLKSPLMNADSNGDGRVNDFLGLSGSGLTTVFSLDAAEQAQKIEITTSTSINGSYVYQDIPVSVGEAISARVTVKISGDVKACVVVHFYSDSGYLHSVAAPFLTNTTYRESILENVIAPSGSTKARIITWVQSNLTGGVGAAWFKKAQLEKSTISHDFVVGIQPMMGLYLQSSGKNLFDVSDLLKLPNVSLYNDDGINCIKITHGFHPISFMGKANTQYTAKYTFKSGELGSNVRLRFIYSDGTATDFSLNNTSYTTAITVSSAGKTVTGIATYYTTGGSVLYKLSDFQIEEGAVATAYEPYQGSALLVEGKFAGIGNYKDKLIYENGVAKKQAKVKSYVLQANDITAMFVSTTNLDYAKVKKPTDFVGYNSFINSNFILDGYPILPQADNAVNVGTVNGNADVDEFFVGFTKETTLAAAQASLTGKILWYGLVASYEEELNTPINGLMAFEGRTTLNLKTGMSLNSEGALVEVDHINNDNQQANIIVKHHKNLRDSYNDSVEAISEINKKVVNMNDILFKAEPNKLSLSTESPVTSIDCKVNGGLDFEMEASPLLVNILGNDGDCENAGKFALSGGATVTLDATKKVFGANSVKATLSSTGSGYVFLNANGIMGTGKYYFASGYVANGNATTGVLLRFYAVDDNSVYSGYNTSTNFVRMGIKIQPSDYNAATSIRIAALVTGESGQYANADGIMVNEITADEYNNLTVDQLLAKYPYVNGIQPMMGLNIKSCGKNLFNGELEIGSIASGNNTTSTTRFRTKNITKIKAGGTFTPSRNNEYVTAGVYLYSDGVYTRFVSGETFTLTATENGYREAFARKVTTETVTQDDLLNANIQLEEGTIATPYEPYQGSELLIEGEFAGIGSYRDKLDYENGVAKSFRRVKKLILDSNLPWAFGSDYAGFKRVVISPYFTDVLGGNENKIAIKYNGSLLTISTATPTAGDIVNFQSTINAITIADSDSGWGESYTPTPDEIKAYFNGWRMYNASSFPNPYNGSGVKAWGKIYCGIGTNDNGIVSGAGTTTLPTTINDMGYTPYQLWYVLATPVEEILPTPINGLSVYKGKTTISLQAGIVKERANPQIAGAFLQLNKVDVPGTNLSHKTNSIIKIIKKRDGIESDDTQNWSLLKNQPLEHGYGGAYATLPKAVAETSERQGYTYYAIYEALPEEYNSQQASITAEYTENLLDSYNELVETAGEMQDSLSKIKTEVRSHSAEDATTGQKGHVQLGTGANQAAQGNHGHNISSITGTVPISQGGTGQTTAALARNALGLGNTTGALPIANGGTGTTTAAAVLTNLGITATAAELNYTDGVTSNIQMQLNAKAALAPSLIAVSTSKTLALTDAGTVQNCTNASAITITIPTNATVAFAVGTEIAIVRQGTGPVAIAPASGVTLNSKDSKRSIDGQYASVALKKMATDTWILVGALTE